MILNDTEIVLGSCAPLSLFSLLYGSGQCSGQCESGVNRPETGLNKSEATHQLSSGIFRPILTGDFSCSLVLWYYQVRTPSHCPLVYYRGEMWDRSCERLPRCYFRRTAIQVFQSTCTHGRFGPYLPVNHVVFVGSHKTRSFMSTWTSWATHITILFVFTTPFYPHNHVKQSPLLYELQTCPWRRLNCPARPMVW